MQAACSIGNEDIDVPRTRRVQGVKDHGGGFGSGLMSDDRHIMARRPDFQLFSRGRAKGIAGRQHDALALGE